jgi:hypothetical protein
MDLHLKERFFCTRCFCKVYTNQRICRTFEKAAVGSVIKTIDGIDREFKVTKAQKTFLHQ